ncbi:hypothetical protein DL96DRAFT_1815015 [Flagelloscypha sp. PMI_526]|nr:hypothetical protein DL96DRAFT_1815015 [Flagelloscypha sp. PMI_526]
MPAITPSDPLYALTVYVLGGWFVGGCIVLFLFGVLTCQISNYFTYYREDKIALKCVVAFLYLLSCLKWPRFCMASAARTRMCLHICSGIIWIHNILWGKDPAGAAKLQGQWYELVNIPIGAVIAFYVQCYYAYRLWILSRKWWAVAPIVAVMLLGLISALITAAALAKTGKSSNWFAYLQYLLFRDRHPYYFHDDFLPIPVEEETIPASICTMVMLICSRLGSTSLLPKATNAVILGLLQALPVIYANCMLYILNTRRNLRLANGSGISSSTGQPPHPSHLPRTRRNGEHELGVLSGIQVSTQVNTNIDFDSPKEHHYVEGKQMGLH